MTFIFPARTPIADDGEHRWISLTVTGRYELSNTVPSSHSCSSVRLAATITERRRAPKLHHGSVERVEVLGLSLTAQDAYSYITVVLSVSESQYRDILLDHQEYNYCALY